MNDATPPSSAQGWSFRPFSELLLALSFLTRLPLPFLRTIDLPPMTHAMRMFPVAGAIIGAISGLFLLAARWCNLPAMLAVAVALALTALLTGALHEDGLSDVADGFGGGATVEQRLDIMRDSRIGAYGTIALICVFLARASVYIELYYKAPLDVVLVLAAAGAVSRALVVDLLWATRPARTDGLSVMAGRPDRFDALVALCLGGLFALFALSSAISPMAAVAGLVAAGLALGIVRALAMWKIGGQTGDVCGAAQVVSELALLAACMAMIG